MYMAIMISQRTPNIPYLQGNVINITWNKPLTGFGTIEMVKSSQLRVSQLRLFKYGMSLRGSTHLERVPGLHQLSAHGQR